MAMERVTVEQNGEQFTLEVPEGTSDADIQSFLNNQQSTAKASDTSFGDIAVPAASAAAIPVVPALANAPAAIGQGYQTAKTVAGPAVSGGWTAAKDIVGTYVRNPGTAAADIAASHLGLPPPAASQKITPLYEGIQQSYANVKDWLGKTGQFAPKVNPATTTAADTAQILATQDVEKAAADIAARQTAQKTAQIAATQGPAAAEGSNFIQSLTQKFAPLAQKVAPVLQSAGQVLNQSTPAQMFALPYQMSAYEQAKIRANPDAPEYKDNPYAMMIRGEAKTQGQAGAINRRRALSQLPSLQ